jgi:Xaa-Pro dipeptidase
MSDQPLYPDFPAEEYQNRYARARALMEREDLDALLLTAEANYVYFTGHRSPQNPVDKIRPYIVLLPREGDPVVFVMPFEEGLVRLTTWISDVRTYGLLQHNSVIVETLKKLDLARARIGCELGREQYLELSYNDFIDLQKRLPEASFVDAADILLAVRAVKSQAEVERMRTICQITSRMHKRLFENVHAGMTNLDIARMIRTFSMEEGAERVGTISMASGKDFTKGKISIPIPRALEAGDTLTVDTSLQLKGYSSDVCWTAVIGKASQQQKDMYQFVTDLNRKCYAALKPGNLCEDVFKVCQEELVKVGRKPQAVGRIGHAVGQEGTEWPSLTMGEKVTLEPGMVFACNPNFVTEYGFFNVEEDLVVTHKGYDFLTAPLAPTELPVLS